MVSAPKNSSNHQIGVRHFFGTFATSIMLQGSTLLQGVILARILGTTGRGNLAAIILWPKIFANIGLLGTHLSSLRAAAANQASYQSTFRAALILWILLSALAVSIGLFLQQWLLPKESQGILWIAQWFMLLYVPAVMLTSMLGGIDQGRGNFKRLNFFRFVQSPIYLILLGALIISGDADLNSCVWAMLGAFWVAAIWRLALFLRRVSLFGSVESIYKLLKKGLPFALVITLQQFTRRADQILLVWLLSEKNLGLYVVALSAASVLTAAAQSMGIVSLTITAQERPGKGFKRVAKIFRAATAVSLAMAVLLSCAIWLLFPVIYGQEFTPARSTAIVLVFGEMSAGLSALLNQCMRGQGKPMAGLMSRLIGLGVMVPVAYVLSEPLRTNGVALAFVAAQMVSLSGLIYLVIKHYNSASLWELIPTLKDTGELIKHFCHMRPKLLVHKQV